MNGRWPIGAVGMLAMLVLAAGGCKNAPPVKREVETARFQEAMRERAENLKLDASRPLSMEEAVKLAMDNSLVLRVRELGLRLQDEQVRLALSNGLPKASLNYSQTYRSNEAAVSFGKVQASFEDREQQRFAVNAAVPVLDFGLTYYAYQIALDHRRQERLLLERSRQLLARDVRIAYAEHAGAIRQEALANIAYQAALQVLRVARTLEREQMTVKADTSIVEAAVAQANLELSLVRRRVARTHLDLAQLMSLPPGVEYSIHPDLPALPQPLSAERLASFTNRALSARPELHVQDLERHISANAVRRAAADFFPRIDVIGSFNWSNQSAAVNPAYFLYGFGVAHSLLDGGATIWRFNLAKKNVDVQSARTILVSLGVVYEVELLALRTREAHETIIAAGILERSRREALDRIISLYKEGMEDEAATARSLADLTAQATILDRAQTDYQVAWYELEAAALPESRPTTQPSTQPATRPALPATLPDLFN